MGPQIVRVEPDHLVEILYGPIVVTFELEIDRPAVPRLDVLRLEPDRLAEVLDGPIEVALPLVGGAPVDVGQRISGVEPERLVEVPDGSIVVALFEIDGPAIIEGLHVARPQADRFVEVPNGAVVGAPGEIGAAPSEMTSGPIGVRELGGSKGPATVADDEIGSFLLEAPLNVARRLRGGGNGHRHHRQGHADNDGTRARRVDHRSTREPWSG